MRTTPEPLLKLSIHLYAAVLSLSETVSILDGFGVDRIRSIGHDRVRNADAEPEGQVTGRRDRRERDPVHGERFCLDEAVDTATNEFLHVGRYNRGVMAFSELCIAELLEKHGLEDAMFLVDGAQWLRGALHRHGVNGDTRHTSAGMRSN